MAAKKKKSGAAKKTAARKPAAAKKKAAPAKKKAAPAKKKAAPARKPAAKPVAAAKSIAKKLGAKARDIVDAGVEILQKARGKGDDGEE